MASAFPGALDNIPNNKTNGMPQLSDHPNHHNLLADAVNAVQAEVRAGGGALRPEWYGAVADVKSAQFDGAMTSGSATLTTGTALFAPADVGKQAVVLGAGAAGTPLATTVAAYTSATVVTLAAPAATTVSATRWAVGSDSTGAINACLVAASAAARPVRLSGLYGTLGVLLQGRQVVLGEDMERTGFYRLGVGAATATVSLAPGVSGDGLCLAGFLVNGMFLGGADGIEIGTTAGVLALASGGCLRDLKVRNAAGWAFNVGCNVALFVNCWSQHDNPPPPASTTAGGHRHVDTLAYGSALSAEGYYPAGAFVLGASGGSVYAGLQMEVAGSYPSTDLVTISGNQQTITGVYATLGTHRDLIRIPAGTRDVEVTGILINSTHTLTNVVNDLDRAFATPGTGAVAFYPRYATSLGAGAGLLADTNGSVRLGLGSLVTGASAGFPYLAAVAGTPTGSPPVVAGMVARVFDTTNLRDYVRTGGAWQKTADLGAWTPHAPTWTGFGAAPTVTSRYIQVGKTVTWSVNLTGVGTSNATTVTATLPVPARAAQTGVGMATVVDNGVTPTTAGRIDLPNTTTAAFFTTLAGGVWTASGGKGVWFTLCYEAG